MNLETLPLPYILTGKAESILKTLMGEVTIGSVKELGLGWLPVEIS
jgi:hypothetical protein